MAAQKYANSFLEKGRKTRKRDIRKLTDVRVPVPYHAHKRLEREARRNHVHVVTYVTQLVEAELLNTKVYSICKYDREDYEVHVKLTEDFYKIVCGLMDEWNVKYLRVALHRVLHNALVDADIL